MNKLKEIFKQITDRLSKTVRYSPDQLERQIILAKLDAIADKVDEMETAIQLMHSGIEIGLAALEDKKSPKKKKEKAE